MSSTTSNDLIKYAIGAGIAGACIGYLISSKSQEKLTKSSVNNEIDLDKFYEKSQYKLVPLLNR